MPRNFEKIRMRVEELLQLNSIKKAPVNPEKIAKSLGIEILLKPAEDELCGFLYRGSGNENVVIGVNQNHHPNRRRFTIAHEIGHFSLHNHQGFHFDSENKSYLLKLRKTNDDNLNRKEEREANIFAAELLMPRKFVEADMLEYKNADLLFGNELPRLARKYQVSVRAFTYRLMNLGFIDSNVEL